MTAQVLPDVEDMLCDALLAIAATVTPHPELEVAPPMIEVARVPGGPPAKPWQITPLVQLTHYGATRKESWALVEATDALLGALNPAGGRLAGWFVDLAEKRVDPALVPDKNPDVRAVPVVWRFVIRAQAAPAPVAP